MSHRVPICQALCLGFVRILRRERVMISICKNNILPAIVFCFVVGGGFFYGSFQEAAATQALAGVQTTAGVD